MSVTILNRHVEHDYLAKIALMQRPGKQQGGRYVSLGAYFAILLLLAVSSFTASAPVYAADWVKNGEICYEPQEIRQFLLSSGRTLTCVCSYSPVQGSGASYHWVCS